MKDTDISGLSARLTGTILRWRRAVAGAIGIACLAALWGLSGLTVSGSMESYVDETDDEVRFFRDRQQAFGDFEVLVVLLEGVSEAQLEDLAAAVHERIAGHPGVVEVMREPADATSVEAGGVSETQQVPLLVVVDRQENGIREQMAIAADIRALIDSSHPNGVEAHLSGLPVIALDAVEQTRTDLFAFLWLMPVLLGAVLVAFYRRNGCVWIPPVVVGAALLLATGLFTGTGNHFDMIAVAFPVVIAVIAFADLIHIIHRYHVEVARLGREEPDTAGTDAQRRWRVVVRTMAAMNIACLMTSVTTAVGFLALSLSPIDAVSTFGMWAAIGILIAYGVVTLLTPILLHRQPLPSPVELDRYFRGRTIRLLGHVPGIALRRGVPVAFAALGVLAVVGLTDIRVETDLRTFLPTDRPSVVAFERLQDSPLGGNRAHVVVEAGGDRDFEHAQAIRQLDDLQQRLAAAFSGVEAVHSIADVLRMQEVDDSLPVTDTDLQEALLRLELGLDERWLGAMIVPQRDSVLMELRLVAQASEPTARLLAQIDDWFEREGPADWQMRTTGPLKLYVMQERMLVESKLQSVLLTIAAIALILWIFLRNVRLTLIAVVANALPALLTLGFMGISGIALNMTTMMMAAIVVALAVDDTIHFIAAWREYRRAGASSRVAIEGALGTSGFAIVVSSMALFAGFFVLLFSGLAPMREFGLMMCVAVGLALVVDLLLLVHLLDRWQRADGVVARARGARA